MAAILLWGCGDKEKAGTTGGAAAKPTATSSTANRSARSGVPAQNDGEWYLPTQERLKRRQERINSALK